MKFTTSIALVALALFVNAQDNGPHIETPPAAQQCGPVLLSISGGTPPYTIAAIPQGQTSAPPLAEITSGLQGNTFTWKVNLAANTAITLRVTDSTGAFGFSGPVNIQASSDTSCLNGSASAGGSTTSAAGSTPPAGSAPPASGSTPGSTPVPPPTTPTGTTSAGTSASRPSTSGSVSGSPSSTGAGASQSAGSNDATTLNAGAATVFLGVLAAAVLV